MATTDLATTAPKIAALFSKLELESSFDDNDVLSGGMSIAEKILAAAESGDEQAIFDAANAGTKGGRDFVGVPFRLHEDNIVVRKSNRDDIDGGMRNPATDDIFYVLLRVLNLETDEEEVINTGGVSLVTTLFALRDSGVMAKYSADGGMPLIIAAKRAAGGDVLLLKPFKAVGSKK